MKETAKRTTTEGLLAIFLGVFGAHYFYQGKIEKGIFRIIWGWGGPFIIFLFGKICPMYQPPSEDVRWGIALSMSFLSPVLVILTCMPVFSAIAGIIEGVHILTTGNEKDKKAETDNAQENSDEKSTDKQEQTDIKQNGKINIQSIYPQPKDDPPKP